VECLFLLFLIKLTFLDKALSYMPLHPRCSISWDKVLQ